MKSFDDKFPNEFSLSLNEFNDVFNLTFQKIDEINTHPIHSSDIYVVDSKSGQPIKYESRIEEVFKNIFLIKSLTYKSRI